MITEYNYRSMRFHTTRRRTTLVLISVAVFIIIYWLLFSNSGVFLIYGGGQQRSSQVTVIVRTSKETAKERLPLLLQTWIRASRESYHILITSPDVTMHNTPDISMQRMFAESNCTSTTSRRLNQCCQLAFGFTHALKLHPESKWFCHFDDDVFVNTRELELYLRRYSEKVDIYLGRSSVSTPFAFKDSSGSNHLFFFATGGAGICLSRALMQKLQKQLDPDLFTRYCTETGLSDDVLLGYVISKEFATQLTISNRLHSHLEDLSALKLEYLEKQISLSVNLPKNNRISLNRYVDNSDTTGFKTLTCLVYRTSNDFLNCSHRLSTETHRSRTTFLK